MQGNLSFDLTPGLSVDPTLVPRGDVASAVARFREIMARPESPVRAIRHQPALPARFVPLPESLDARLQSSYEQRGIAQISDFSLHGQVADRAVDFRCSGAIAKPGFAMTGGAGLRPGLLSLGDFIIGVG